MKRHDAFFQSAPEASKEAPSSPSICRTVAPQKVAAVQNIVGLPTYMKVEVVYVWPPHVFANGKCGCWNAPSLGGRPVRFRAYPTSAGGMLKIMGAVLGAVAAAGVGVVLY